MNDRWYLRAYLIGMIGLFLLLLAGLHLTARVQAQGTEFVTNGTMQDADLNGLPDGWQQVPASKLDTLTCVGFTRATCWYRFNSYNSHRGIRQLVTLYTITPIPAVTFSFRGKGLLTDSGAAGAVYVYEGGVFPTFSKFILLPVGTAFDNTFTVTFAIPPTATGFQVDFTAARAGVWSVTDVSLQEAALPAPAAGDLPINGAFIDTDGDNLPDGWEGMELAPTDGVTCKAVCSFKFKGSGQRALFTMVEAFTPPGQRITLSVDVVLSNVGENSYFQILGMYGKHLTTNYLLVIPPGVRQKRKITISGVVRGEGADRFYVILNITRGKVKLTDAHLMIDAAVLSLPNSTPTESPPPDPVARCRPTGISEWRLHKQKVYFDEYHGYVLKCYYNTPGIIFPPDTKALCPVELHNLIDGKRPYTEHWTRFKFIKHIDPLRVRCVYSDYSITDPGDPP